MTPVKDKGIPMSLAGVLFIIRAEEGDENKFVICDDWWIFWCYQQVCFRGMDTNRHRISFRYFISEPPRMLCHGLVFNICGQKKDHKTRTHRHDWNRIYRLIYNLFNVFNGDDSFIPKRFYFAWNPLCFNNHNSRVATGLFWPKSSISKS